MFDSHMSGFVYKVRVDQRVLIKKEIPGPDTVDEFLYEVNALNRLRASHNVIQFYGVIVDDNDEKVKGLLISFADKGALIDIIYDSDHSLPWSTREKWARQIVEGLSEIHEAGFVQGDFTLSNIVIDDQDNAKIIDINRRGCPVGWEPPEATPPHRQQPAHLHVHRRQVGPLPARHGALGPRHAGGRSRGPRPAPPARLRRRRAALVPHHSQDLSGRRSEAAGTGPAAAVPVPEPRAGRRRLGPAQSRAGSGRLGPARSAVGLVRRRPLRLLRGGYGGARVLTVQPPNDWSMVNLAAHPYVDAPSGLLPHEPFFFPTRGRSPPSPLPSNPGCDSPRPTPAWSALNYDRARAVASTTEETRSETMTTTTSTDSLRFGQKLDDTAVVTTEPLDGSQGDRRRNFRRGRDTAAGGGGRSPARDPAGAAQQGTEQLVRPCRRRDPRQRLLLKNISSGSRPCQCSASGWQPGWTTHPRPLSASDTTGITAPEHLNDRCENQTPKTGTPGAARPD